MPKSKTDETTIPALPCVALAETLPFYQVLGFDVTYQQKSPNPYAVVRRGGIELHFFGLKGLKPEEAFSTCLVIVPEVESLHATFAEALRQAYRKLPIAGFPHITRMKPGQSRFTIVDPAGNSVIFIKRETQSATGKRKPDGRSQSRLAKAIDTAATLRDSKGDDAAAANVLDVAVARNEPATPVDRARALAARAELAVALGDAQHARALGVELRKIPLSETDRRRLRHELDAANQLERSLLPTDARDGDLRAGPG
ncbi:MAG: hypothetical protein EXS05_24575 [Planctomycetaceae bacterium]|nr:hypothetical protein [Planctomycetaceae bacterium]